MRQSTTLFFGNLPYGVTERELEDVVADFRPVNVSVGFNYRTNQSKGFAFVEFETRRDAEDAFRKFDVFFLFVGNFVERAFAWEES